MKRFVSVLLLGLLAGCGYQFAGTTAPFPPELKTVSLGPIENKTREVGLEKALLEALEDEVSARTLLSVAPPDEADLQLRGTIDRYVTQPVAFNDRDEALQYQVRVSVALVLEEREDGRIWWSAQRLEEAADYGAVSGVLVTSSSQFQRANPAAADLGGFTDIQVSEAQRREANERLVESLARTIYNRMMEDF